MKKLAVILAVTLVMAIAIPLTGCGSSGNSAVVSFISRPNTSSTGTYLPRLSTLDPTTKTATAVVIPIPETAYYVSANSDGTAVTYCRYPSTVSGTTSADVSSTYDIYLMGTDGIEKELTTNADACESVFSPDGKTIAYSSYQSGSYYPQIFTMNVDGSNQKALYTNTIPAYSEYQLFPQFSPDGKSLVFYIYMYSDLDMEQMHRPNAAHTSRWLLERNRHVNHDVRKIAHPQDTVPYQSGWYTMGLTAATPNFVYAPNYIYVWGPAVFSSDGTKLLITDVDYDLYAYNIYSVGLDGSGLAELTTSSDTYDFSPVAYKGIILFNRLNYNNGIVDIYAMDENGANQILIHSNPDAWEALIDTYRLRW